MKRSLSSSIAIGVTVLLLFGCRTDSVRSPFFDLPEAPEMNASVLLMYWLVEGIPPEVDEAVLLHDDGAITYLDRAHERQGAQYVGPEGVSYFAELLLTSGFPQLDSTYQPERRGDEAHARYVMLAMRIDKDVKRVQWQEPAVPSAIAGAAREIEQFVQVVRASAH